MKRSFGCELRRSIKHSLGRFIAILLIVALGCGFFAGLKMTGLNMRHAADMYYDKACLYDLDLVSTMGFDSEQIDLIQTIPQVDKLSLAYSVDVVADVDQARNTMRISSIDQDFLDEVLENNGDLSDKGYLNQLELKEGRWPKTSGECVLSANIVSDNQGMIGDEVKVLYASADLDDVLVTDTFKVVGLVTSPVFTSAMQVGYTNLGDGSLDQFMYVAPSAFAENLPYTQVYVSVVNSQRYAHGSDAYKDCVNLAAKAIQSHVPELENMRTQAVLAEAKEQMEEKKDQLQEGKMDAKAQFLDAHHQLNHALCELDTALAKLNLGEKRADEAAAVLESKRQEVQDKYDYKKSILDKQSLDIQTQRNQIPASYEQLITKKTRLEKELEQDPSQTLRDELKAVKSSIEKYKKLDKEEQKLQETLAGYKESKAKIDKEAEESGLSEEDKAAIYGPMQKQLEDSIAKTQDQIAVTAHEKAALGSSLEELQAKESEIQAKLDASPNQTLRDEIHKVDKDIRKHERLDEKAKLLDGRYEELEYGYTYAMGKIDKTQAELIGAQDEIEAGKKQLDKGRQDYIAGSKDYQARLEQTEKLFGDAAIQLKEAQSSIDGVEKPKIFVLDRSHNLGASLYYDDSLRMDNIASVFPLIFFLVAALVSLTTMTRMVEEERIDIGTHKALGFTSSYIAGKYLCYAGLASGIGAAVGIGALGKILPMVIIKAYGIAYIIPCAPSQLIFDPRICIASFVLGVGICLIATAIAAHATLLESPAQLMLPRAPKPGQRIGLEHLSLWRHISFSWKVSLRNLFRYKKRLFMTVIGIAGCTALVLTGLGLHDSIWDIIDKQFEGRDPIFLCNCRVSLEDDLSRRDINHVEEVLKHTAGADNITCVDAENVRIGLIDSEDPYAIQLIVPDDTYGLSHAISLRQRTDGSPIDFTSKSCVLTEKMAKTLDVDVGDTIQISQQDMIGNPIEPKYEFEVTDIAENYVYHYLYIAPELYEKTTGQKSETNTVLCNVDQSESSQALLESALHDTDAVKTCVFNTQTIETYRNSMVSVNMIVGVLVLAAACLAFIVLYNLTNVNILERTREIATLKVLGFTKTEVVVYVFREIFMLVGIGSLVGFGLGRILEGFVIVSSEVDAVMFGRQIHLISYGQALGITLGFAFIVMLTMLPKIRRISMVESLKSID